MNNISRRTFIATAGGALPLTLLTSSCGNANSILTAINTITNDAEQVLTAVQGSVCTVAQTTPCLSQADYNTIMAWITSLQAANAQALNIDAGAAKLTVAQITDITLVYSQVVLGNITLPANVQKWVTIAQEAIQALLSLLGTAQATANAAPSHSMVLTISWDHLESARGKNAALKTNIAKTQAKWRASRGK